MFVFDHFDLLGIDAGFDQTFVQQSRHFITTATARVVIAFANVSVEMATGRLRWRHYLAAGLAPTNLTQGAS